jgi:hypothetical protein
MAEIDVGAPGLYGGRQCGNVSPRKEERPDGGITIDLMDYIVLPPDEAGSTDDMMTSASRASSEGRGGFQRLIAEIGLGKAGLVLSPDASRLARNNHDWHRLLELCSLFGVLIADGERLYDPCAYHHRLLLGLSGIMSEAELHQIKVRLHQGERQKAARGELRLPLPAGCAPQRPSIAAGNRGLRSVRPAHGSALFRAERQLPGVSVYR